MQAFIARIAIVGSGLICELASLAAILRYISIRNGNAKPAGSGGV